MKGAGTVEVGRADFHNTPLTTVCISACVCVCVHVCAEWVGPEISRTECLDVAFQEWAREKDEDELLWCLPWQVLIVVMCG